MNKCTDSRGNQICTNGKDTYHEWNYRYSKCNYCGLGKEKFDELFNEDDSIYCECDRCYECGKLVQVLTQENKK